MIILENGKAQVEGGDEIVLHDIPHKCTGTVIEVYNDGEMRCEFMIAPDEARVYQEISYEKVK